MNSQNITRDTGFLGKILDNPFNKEEKFSLKTFIAAISLVGIVTTATVGNVQEVWGSSGSSTDGTSTTLFSEEVRICNFVDGLQETLPGLDKLYDSSGSSGNILFYRTSQKQDIVMLTSGGYSPQATREANLKKLGINSNSNANVYSLSAIDTVFLCDPDAELIGREIGVMKVEDKDEGHYSFYCKPKWRVGRETLELRESIDGLILSPKFVEKLLPPLIKYLEVVVREVTPDALIDRISEDKGFDEEVNGSLCILLKNQIGQHVRWYYTDVIRQCLTGTTREPEKPITDNILFDLMKGKARLSCKTPSVSVNLDAGESISISRSDKKEEADAIVDFISSLRGGKSKKDPKPDNACIVADVAIGNRVILKLRQWQTGTLPELLEAYKECQAKFDKVMEFSSSNVSEKDAWAELEKTILAVTSLFSYAFNGQGGSTCQTVLEPTEADWLKRALHTEVQYAVLQHLKKIRAGGSASSSSSAMVTAVNPLNFIPSEENIVFSLLDPCVSCARTPLILGCKGDSKEDNLIFLYVTVDDNGNKRKVPYEPYLRYAFDKLQKLAPNPESLSGKSKAAAEKIKTEVFPKSVVAVNIKGDDLNQRRSAWSKGILDPIVTPLKEKLNIQAPTPPIFLKWDGELK